MHDAFIIKKNNLMKKRALYWTLKFIFCFLHGKGYGAILMIIITIAFQFIFWNNSRKTIKSIPMNPNKYIFIHYLVLLKWQMVSLSYTETPDSRYQQLHHLLSATGWFFWVQTAPKQARACIEGAGNLLQNIIFSLQWHQHHHQAFMPHLSDLYQLKWHQQCNSYLQEK